MKAETGKFEMRLFVALIFLWFSLLLFCSILDNASRIFSIPQCFERPSMSVTHFAAQAHLALTSRYYIALTILVQGF